MENIAIKLALSDNKLKELNAEEYFQVKQKAEDLTKESEDLVNKNIDLKNTEAELRLAIIQSNETLEKTNKQIESQKKKLSKIKELYKSMENALDKFFPGIRFRKYVSLTRVRFGRSRSSIPHCYAKTPCNGSERFTESI